MVTQHTQTTTAEQLKRKPNNMVCTNYKFAVVLDPSEEPKGGLLFRPILL